MQRNFFSQIKDKMLEGLNLLNPQMPSDHTQSQNYYFELRRENRKKKKILWTLRPIYTIYIMSVHDLRLALVIISKGDGKKNACI